MNVPSKYGAITLEQYYRLLFVLGEKYADDQERIIAILSALTDKPKDFFTDTLSVKDLKKAIKSLSFIGQPIEKVKPRPSIKINGRRFHVDLILKESIASTFIDISEVCKNTDELPYNYHKVLAIFFHEVNWLGFKKKRTVKTQNEIADFLLKNCTIDVAAGYGSFFLTSCLALSRATNAYLDLQIKATNKRIKKALNQVL